MRKIPLVEGEIYHVFSKTISGFKIFRNKSEYERMRNLIRYYRIEKPSFRFSAFSTIKKREKFYQKHLLTKKCLVEMISYCLMPTHIHLILKQVKDRGISIFMSKVLNSYTKYFNHKNKRKGPLWEGRFQNVRVKTDEQLLHLTRYIHLNPVTAHLVDKPQDWKFSSYLEFLEKVTQKDKICNYSVLLSIKPDTYREFVNSHIDYQRELASIKKLLLE